MLVLGLVVVALFLSGCQQQSDEQEYADSIVFLNWEDYLGENTLDMFYDQYGITVEVVTFEEESEMISTLISNPESFDVVVGSGPSVDYLIETKNLAKLNLNNIPNYDLVSETFKNSSYDPGNNYSMPYLWGTTGIAYNSSRFSEDITSLSILWDEKQKGNISMLASIDELIVCSSKHLDFDISNISVDSLDLIEQDLLNQKPILLGYFYTISIMGLLDQGEINASLCYSGDAFWVMDENENISYVIPDEGCSIWVDNLFIPKGSSKKATAELFINFILEPEVIANVSNYQWYANAIPSSEEYIDSEILEDESIYISEDILNRCVFLSDIPQSLYSEYNRIWAELQKE